MKLTFSHTIPNVLQKNKTEDTIQKFKLQKTHENKMKGRADCQIPFTRAQNILCSNIRLNGVKVFSALQIPSAWV